MSREGSEIEREREREGRVREREGRDERGETKEERGEEIDCDNYLMNSCLPACCGIIEQS